MTTALQRLAQWTLLASLLLLPVYSFQEVLALFSAQLGSQQVALTHWAIKGVKDLAFIISLISGMTIFLLRGSVSRYIFFFFILGMTSAIFFLLSFKTSPLVALSGLRWILPVFLILGLIPIVDELMLKRMARFVYWLFWPHFGFQIFELFYAKAWFGENMLGLASRAPGIFLIPNTGALFSLCVLFLNFFYGGLSGWKKIFLYCCVFLSVIFTASGTGIVTLLILSILVSIRAPWRRVLLLAVPLIAILSLPILGFITDRGEDYVEISLGTRWEIFNDLWRTVGWLPDMFGMGTNSGVLLLSTGGAEGEAIIVDSTINSILANFGGIGLILFCIALGFWLAMVLVKNKIEPLGFSVIFLIFGFITIIPEVFPANLIFAACLAYYLKTDFQVGRLTTNLLVS